MDRRRRRSELPAEAAKLYLQALAERHRLSAVALVDADGFIVVVTPEEATLEGEAAIAPLCARGTEPAPLDERHRGEETVWAWRVEIEGHAYFLVARGERAPAASEADQALRRILFGSA